MKQESDILTAGYAIYNQQKTLMYMTFPTDAPRSEWKKLKKGKVILTGIIPKHLLNAGKYKVCIVAAMHNKFWILDPDGLIPSIEYQIDGGLSDSPNWTNTRSGYLAPEIKWKVNQ